MTPDDEERIWREAFKDQGEEDLKGYEFFVGLVVCLILFLLACVAYVIVDIGRVAL